MLERTAKVRSHPKWMQVLIDDICADTTFELIEGNIFNQQADMVEIDVQSGNYVTVIYDGENYSSHSKCIDTDKDKKDLKEEIMYFLKNRSTKPKEF